PNAIPGKTVPSSSASRAGPRSPTRGSTIELARGNGGITRAGGRVWVGGRGCFGGGDVLTRWRSRNRARHENATGPRGSVDARTHSIGLLSGLTGPVRRA